MALTYQCSKCKEHKAESAFHPQRSARRKRAVQSWCKVCDKSRNLDPKVKQRKRSWLAANREKANAYHREYYQAVSKHREGFLASRAEYAKWRRRLKKYGVTKEYYETLMVEQDGKCLICSVEKWRDLRVDHNHDTGAVRGLLCAECNSGIGFLKESIDNLRGAIRYLTER